MNQEIADSVAPVPQPGTRGNYTIKTDRGVLITYPCPTEEAAIPFFKELTVDMVCNAVSTTVDKQLPLITQRDGQTRQNESIILYLVGTKETHQNGNPHFHVICRVKPSGMAPAVTRRQTRFSTDELSIISHGHVFRPNVQRITRETPDLINYLFKEDGPKYIYLHNKISPSHQDVLDVCGNAKRLPEEELLETGTITREWMEKYPKYLTRMGKVREGLLIYNSLKPCSSRIWDNLYLKPWQSNLVAKIIEEIKPRHTDTAAPISIVEWVWCDAGGSGKSTMCAALSELTSCTLECGMCNSAAFGCIFREFHEKQGKYPAVVVFDIPRSVDITAIKGLFQLLEPLGNGRLTASKYQSKHMVFKPPKCIVFSNVNPNQDPEYGNRISSFISAHKFREMCLNTTSPDTQRSAIKFTDISQMFTNIMDQADTSTSSCTDEPVTEHVNSTGSSDTREVNGINTDVLVPESPIRSNYPTSETHLPESTGTLADDSTSEGDYSTIGDSPIHSRPGSPDRCHLSDSGSTNSTVRMGKRANRQPLPRRIRKRIKSLLDIEARCEDSDSESECESENSLNDFIV